MVIMAIVTGRRSSIRGRRHDVIFRFFNIRIHWQYRWSNRNMTTTGMFGGRCGAMMPWDDRRSGSGGGGGGDDWWWLKECRGFGSHRRGGCDRAVPTGGGRGGGGPYRFCRLLLPCL